MRSIGRPIDAPEVEDMDDAVPGRPCLERLGYRCRLHELGGAAVQPLHRIPELVRVNFRSHSARSSRGLPPRAETASARSPDGLQGLADILREQQWLAAQMHPTAPA